MNLRVLIVDDEAPARARLRRFLAEEPGVEVVGECANGREAVAFIQGHRPDLVFLDVQMPGLNGLEVCQALAGGALPRVIFVTAYDQYALQAFEVHALDYLLKPFDQERFRRALAHARQQLRSVEPDELDRRIKALLAQAQPAPAPSERLAFKSEGRVVFVKLGEIDWLEADGNYVRIHAGGQTHLLRETLSSLESRLDPASFLRVSRSAIVHLDRVKEIQPLFYGDQVVILRNGVKVNLSRNFRDKLEALLLQGRPGSS